jgi:hypothetical protein
MIEKCFITGVSPMCMADFTSGFNSATYVSWHEKLAGLCGPTNEDVVAALSQIASSKQMEENDFVQKHFNIMRSYYNGFNFVEGKNVTNYLLNTNTCFQYLQVSLILPQLLLCIFSY